MRCKICGSMAINPHTLGRDNADLDLCDVCYWRKRANGAKPTLSDVLAKIVTKSENSIEFSDSAGDLCAVIRVSDVKEILSEYFA